MLGKTVSHYEVTHLLGAGGMGEVYAATDTLLGRAVAIKVLHTEDVVTEESRLRFLQEARAASALNHPNIVTIYDVIRQRDLDCIVMELVQGETLDARVARGPVPLDEALDILDAIAGALAAAHARGIVHRDLKPGNVMLTFDGRVKVLDFGLAKLLGELPGGSNTPASPHTQSGIVVGTPAFMSPEQVKGQPIDGRSDLFTLGTIAMEMLTGVNPFESDSVIATMHRIGYDAAPPLGGLPEPAATLVARMLAKDRDHRIQSATEVREAIAGIRSGKTIEEPVTLDVAENVAPIRKRPAALKRAAAAAAVLTVVGLGVTGSKIWRAQAAKPPAPVAASMATPAFTAPRTALDHVNAGNELLKTYWRKGYVDKAVEEFQRAIALDANHAPAHAGLATAYWRKYDREKDKAWLELGLKNARHAVELDPQLAVARVARGITELASGNADTARKELEQTLVIDPNNAPAHRWLSEVALRAKDERAAEAELRKALALQPRDIDVQNVLGTFLYKSARYQESVAMFRQVIALAPDFASPYRNLGASLHMLGDYSGAARALQQSLEISPKASTYSNLGTLYFFQGLYPQAVSAFEKALQLGANDHVMWANLGDAYRWTPGNQAKAREAFTTALHLLEEETRANPDDATLRSRQALYLAKLGNAAAALAAADSVVKRGEKNPQNLYRLALAYELGSARDKSLKTLSKAIRGGYSVEEVKVDPELASLRRDVQYQRMMVKVR